MRFTTKQYVRWDDLDAMGHVNHAKYLTYAQEARFAMLGMFNMVVARAEVDYKSPISEGNFFVDMNLWVESIGTSSFVMAYEITHNGTVFARVKSVQVTVTEDTLSSRPLTDAQREVLNSFLDTE